MWSVIRWLVLRIAAVRWLFKMGWLGVLVAIAMVLKTLGLPVLAVLSILALPVFVLLLLFGLPFFLVFVAGGLLMGVLGAVLSIGLAALKIGLFVVLPAMIVLKIGSKLWKWGPGCGRKGDTGPDDSGPSHSDEAPPPPPPPPHPPSPPPPPPPPRPATDPPMD